MSRLIGPAPSRHHNAPKQPAKITIKAAMTMPTRFTQRSPAMRLFSAAQRSPSRRRESKSGDATCNSLMVDPPKATKGRRMSKKTRKKSPKTSSRKSAGGPSTSSAKSKRAKTSRMATVKSGKRATAKASHKAPSKRLTTSKAAASGPTRASKRESSVLAEGAKAPDFHLPRDGGGTVSLADYLGKKLV